MDETGFLHLCIPNVEYVLTGHLRQVYGTKSMKATDCITLVLACHAAGSPKIQVALIGIAKHPKGFKAPRHVCHLPYFLRPSACIDGSMFESFLETELLPSLRARTHLLKALISENCETDEEQESVLVAVVSLPLNSTSVCQPLDLGGIVRKTNGYC